MEYMNCGQKIYFTLGVYYVKCANDKLMKLSEGCKTPENKFDYFLQKQRCKYKYVFPGFSNFSTKI
jgi:hypothetical protein